MSRCSTIQRNSYLLFEENKNLSMFSIALDGSWETSVAFQKVDIQSTYFHNDMSDLIEFTAKDLESEDLNKREGFKSCEEAQLNLIDFKNIAKTYTIDCSALESCVILNSVGTLHIKNLSNIADFQLTLFTESLVDITPEKSLFYQVLVRIDSQEAFSFSGNIEELRESLGGKKIKNE